MSSLAVVTEHFSEIGAKPTPRVVRAAKHLEKTIRGVNGTDGQPVELSPYLQSLCRVKQDKHTGRIERAL